MQNLTTHDTCKTHNKYLYFELKANDPVCKFIIYIYNLKSIEDLYLCNIIRHYVLINYKKFININYLFEYNEIFNKRNKCKNTYRSTSIKKLVSFNMTKCIILKH